jgi:hypothetical protein
MLALRFSPEHVKAVVAFLRTLTDAELSQVIVRPESLVGRLSGFTVDHLQTAVEVAVVQLAKDEQTWRRDEDTGKLSRQAKRVSIGALIVAILAMVVAAAAWRFPVR